VDAILAGQGDGAELAKLRDPHIQADTETIRKSLGGNWRPEHLFTLAQSRELHRIYQQQIVNCALQIEKSRGSSSLVSTPRNDRYHPIGNENDPEAKG
jgi:hypothetical protein